MLSIGLFQITTQSAYVMSPCLQHYCSLWRWTFVGCSLTLRSSGTAAKARQPLSSTLELTSTMASLPNLDLNTFSRVALTPGTRDWWSSVPPEPGWYVVETNAPVSALEVLIPAANCAKHYNFSRRVAAVALLQRYGEIILPSAAGQSYVVYSGEGRDLKARAREHTHGNGGTGCLGLSGYPALTAYTWTFLYRTCEAHVPGSNGDKLLRTLLEQRWRTIHGWPLLCKQ